MRKLTMGPVTTKGIDVSDWQTPLDWASAKMAGIEFAFIKVSEGGSYKAKRAAEHFAGARGAGVLTGPYHYYRFDLDPIEQAEHFLGCMPPHYELPPVLDVEWADERRSVNDRDAAKILQCLEQIERTLSRTPIIYTAASFFFGMTNPGAFKRFTPWIAHYTNGSVNVPDPWEALVFWQFTDRLDIPNYASHVDGNLFNGSLADLRRFAGGGTIPEAPTTGATREEKQSLQVALNGVGANPKLFADGIIGPKSKAALRWAADTLN